MTPAKRCDVITSSIPEKPVYLLATDQQLLNHHDVHKLMIDNRHL